MMGVGVVDVTDAGVVDVMVWGRETKVWSDESGWGRGVGREGWGERGGEGKEIHNPYYQLTCWGTVL